VRQVVVVRMVVFMPVIMIVAAGFAGGMIVITGVMLVVRMMIFMRSHAISTAVTEQFRINFAVLRNFNSC